MIKYMKKGDRYPYVRATLGTVSDGVRTLANLSGSTIRFIMRKSGESVAAINNILQGGEIVDAANGQVEYRWRLGDTDAVGDYLVEFEVTDPADKKLTYWDLRKTSNIKREDSPELLIIRIAEDLG